MDLGQLITAQERRERRRRREQRECDEQVINLRRQISRLRKSMADNTATAEQEKETLFAVKSLKKALLKRMAAYG